MRKKLIKIFAILQVFVLAFGVCACSKSDKVEVFNKEECVNFIDKFDVSKDNFFDALTSKYLSNPEEKTNVEGLRELLTEIDFSMRDFVANYEMYKQVTNAEGDVVATYNSTGFEYKINTDELSINFADPKVRIVIKKSGQESMFELICFGENEYAINFWQKDKAEDGYSVLKAKIMGSSGRLKFDQSVFDQFESIMEREDFTEFAQNTGVGFFYTTD